MKFSELDTVISNDPLLRPYGKGQIQKIKNGLAKVEYVPHVFSSPPLFAHTKLVKLEETERIPSPIERLKAGELDEPWKFDLRQMAARFLTANKGGQLSNTRTELLPHQIFTAHEVVKSKRRRFLLADEVGLGKTIESGIIWQALLHRGKADRTLVICPAGLTLQWQEEMQEKFGEFFEIFNRDFQTINPRIWDLKTTAIASIDALKRPEHKAKLLENRDWDLIIFDEAHKLSAREYGTKLDKTHNFQLAEDLKEHTDALLLLTATPHQGEENQSRFVNMIKLLDENIDFTPLFHGDLPLFKSLPSGGKSPYYDYILRTPKLQVTDASGHKVFRGRKTRSYTFNMFVDEAKLYHAVSEYLRKGYAYLDRLTDKNRRLALGFVLSTFQKIAASSSTAIKSSLRARKMRLMHKRQTVEERGLFEDERFEGEYWERQVSFEFEDKFITNEIEEIESILNIDVRQDVKTEELLKFIKRVFKEITDTKEKKIVIFTEYLATQQYLVEQLERTFGSGSTTIIKGQLDVDERNRNRLKFRDDDKIHFLVSTESGGEGINLQFCHVLFNYDMPWNPMRVEQRVGRIYRYGQNKVAQIYNFRTKDTIEDKINGYVEVKLKLVAQALSKVTGEDVEEIVAVMYGEMENEIDYYEIYRRSFVTGDIEESKEEIDRGIERAKRAYELATQELFKDVSSYSFENYEKHLKTELTLKDLELFTKSFLKHKRRQVNESDGVYSFITPKELQNYVQDRYDKVTFNRQKAIDDPTLNLFGIGNSFVDAMFRLCGSIEFGGFISHRVIKNEKFSGTCGIQFNYIVRSRVQREEEEFLFDMYTVFVDQNYQINDQISYLCQRSYSNNESVKPIDEVSFEIERSAVVAEQFLKDNIELIWDWDEDVDLLNVAIVEVY